MPWWMFHEKLWLTGLAWLGILFPLALVGSLWLPDMAERFRLRRRRPLRRVGLLAELAVRVVFAFAAKVMRLDRTGAR